MCGGAHALSPFCATFCGASFAASATGGASKLRSAVRARKRRERTVLSGKTQEIGDFGVAQLLEFAQEQDFAVHGFELLDGAADPQARLGGIPLRGIGRRVSLAEERGAEGGFAAMGAEN